MDIASLTISIVALVLCVLEPILGIILGVIGLVLGIISKSQKSKYSTGGIVISTIAIVISISVFLFIILFMVTFNNPIKIVAEDARRELFSESTKTFIEAIEEDVTDNKIECINNINEQTEEYKKIGELTDGNFYLFFATDEETILSNYKDFSEEIATQAEKQSTCGFLANYPFTSSFQNEKMFGWIHIKKKNNSYEYYIALTDIKGHGIEQEIKKEDIKKDSILLNKAKADMMNSLNIINTDEDSYYCIINN